MKRFIASKACKFIGCALLAGAAIIAGDQTLEQGILTTIQGVLE